MKECFSPIDQNKPVSEAQELLVIDGYLPNGLCQRLVSFADWCPSTVAPVADPRLNGDVGITQSDVFIADRIEFFTDRSCVKIAWR
jgi:hypothetical protein